MSAEQEFMRTRAMLRSAGRPAFVVNKTYGCPLYGFPAGQMSGKACCEWSTFIQSFCDKWEHKFNALPMLEIVKKARSDWSRYSMTGYESFITQSRKLSESFGLNGVRLISTGVSK